MKNVIMLASAVLVLNLLPVQAATDLAGQAPAALQQQIPLLMKKTAVPGLVIAKVENGKLVWQAAFGERAPGKATTTDTVFNVASLTKPVFATMVLHAVAAKKLQLDDALANAWVDPDIADDPRHQLLSARTVLSHQSGLPNWRGNNKLAFMFSPGERHEYSGEGFEYLRRALERITKQTMPQLMAQYVLQPAGLSDMYFGWHPELSERVATGYNEAGEPLDTKLQHFQPNAAAHLMTTAGAYANFASWVISGAQLPQQLAEQMANAQAMHNNPAERFGLGWKLIPLATEEALMHDGREPGVRSYAIVLPKAKQALVILTNSSNGELIFRPLLKAALPQGAEILASTDRLVWHYLTQLPAQALQPMSRGIARSPSYLSTLLHAVDTALIQPSELSAADKALAASQVEKYVLARQNGTVDAARAQALIERLLQQHGDELQLHSHFDKAAALAWLNALQQI